MGVSEVFFEVIGHAMKRGVDHVGSRMDKAAGIGPTTAYQPPAFQPPPMPTLPTIPGMSTLPTLPAYVPVTYAGTALGAVAASEQPAPAKETAPDPRDEVHGSYSDQVAQGIACLACTDGHMNGLLSAVEDAQIAVQSGDEIEARRQWANIAAEIDAMVAIDWSPDKLAATPPEDVAVIESIRGCIAEIREAVPTPEKAGLALGSAKENARFAVSPHFTDRDRAEIETRLRIIGKNGNGMERGDLLDTQSESAVKAADALRKARHVIDQAHADNTLYAPETHKEVRHHLEQAAIALTPTPTEDQLNAVAQLCQSCAETFYAAYFDPERSESKA